LRKLLLSLALLASTLPAFAYVTDFLTVRYEGTYSYGVVGNRDVSAPGLGLGFDAGFYAKYTESSPGYGLGFSINLMGGSSFEEGKRSVTSLEFMAGPDFYFDLSRTTALNLLFGAACADAEPRGSFDLSLENDVDTSVGFGLNATLFWSPSGIKDFAFAFGGRGSAFFNDETSFFTFSAFVGGMISFSGFARSYYRPLIW